VIRSTAHGGLIVAALIGPWIEDESGRRPDRFRGGFAGVLVAMGALAAAILRRGRAAASP